MTINPNHEYDASNSKRDLHSRIDRTLILSLIVKRRERTQYDLMDLPTCFDRSYSGPQDTASLKEWFLDTCKKRLEDNPYANKQPVSFNHFLTLLRKGRKAREQYEEMLSSYNQDGGDK